MLKESPIKTEMISSYMVPLDLLEFNHRVISPFDTNDRLTIPSNQEKHSNESLGNKNCIYAIYYTDLKLTITNRMFNVV